MIVGRVSTHRDESSDLFPDCEHIMFCVCLGSLKPIKTEKCNSFLVVKAK